MTGWVDIGITVFIETDGDDEMFELSTEETEIPGGSATATERWDWIIRTAGRLHEAADYENRDAVETLARLITAVTVDLRPAE